MTEVGKIYHGCMMNIPTLAVKIFMDIEGKYWDFSHRFFFCHRLSPSDTTNWPCSPIHKKPCRVYFSAHIVHCARYPIAVNWLLDTGRGNPLMQLISKAIL